MNIIYDIEVYPNFFCLCMKKGDKYYIVYLDQLKLLPFKDKNVFWIGFNNRKYDHPIIKEALKGASESDLYKLSKEIIYENRNVITWEKNIIDLYGICPVKRMDDGKKITCSLKEFGHRMQYPHLENLPYDFDTNLTDKQKDVVAKYCVHDVKITAMLWEHLKPEYETRQSLKMFFNIDTEFSGAPKLAERCILSELDGHNVVQNRNIAQYKQTNLVLSDKMRAWYEEAFANPYENYKKKIQPEFMKKHSMGDYEIKLGIGGSHVFGKAGVYHDVYEYDVTSYYPSIILKCKLGLPLFRQIYKRIYDQRLRLKESGKIVGTFRGEEIKGASALKLVLNALFGKFNDPYADPQIFAPNLCIVICLLGQFYLQDLIEKLKPNTLILANTDSVVVKEPIDDSIIKEWSERTGFKLEREFFKTYIAKDVNNMYALRDGGSEKRKGCFLKPSWTHNCRAPIIQEAVLNYFLQKMTVEQTFRNPPRIYDYCFFVVVSKKGWFLLNGEKIKDKRIRYYCSTKGEILKKKTEKRIFTLKADTNITLAMDLTVTNPINYEWYVKEAYKLIETIQS